MYRINRAVVELFWKQTMNFDATPRRTDAAGHSGQNKTVKRSAIKLSKIARYSASFEFFVVFVLPEL